MKFTELNVSAKILQALQREGYNEATPIQQQAIPLALEGQDVIGIAQTGTGKTAAFSIPLLQRLTIGSSRANRPRGLILAPTRELAAQITASLDTYGQYLSLSTKAIYGGVGQNPQVKALKNRVDVVVATPGRLLDLANQGHIKFDDIEVFVLDEADRMLDMGFINDIRKIVKKIPQSRQTLFFSATMSKDVDRLARSILKNPQTIEINPQATTAEKIDQYVLYVQGGDKYDLLTNIIDGEDIQRALVFTRTKHKANKLARELSKSKIRADAIHGNKSQGARTRALNNFKMGKTRVLVATDVASRGIDVDDITHVINYELPNEPESYVHRIGRTARAGSEGIAYSFCSADEKYFLNEIEKKTRSKIPFMDHDFHCAKAQMAPGKTAKKRGGGRGRGRRRRRN